MDANQESTIISFSLFVDISSQNGGTILNSIQGTVSLIHNEFIRVTSNKSPGCFYIESCSKLLMDSNYFVACSGSGGNNYYGNILNCLSSKYICNYFSAYLCAPSTTPSADSLIRASDCNTDILYYNSSFCYGIDGSSSVSIVKITKNNNIKYMNAIHNINYDILELWGEKSPSFVYQSNFINGTKNTMYFLHIGIDTAFYDCVFAQSGEKPFCSNINKCSFNNCTCDKYISDITFNIVLEPTTVKFEFHYGFCSNSKNTRIYQLLCTQIIKFLLTQIYILLLK